MKLPDRQTRASGRGFTLLELMLASAIMAVLAMSLYSSLTTAFRARRSAMAQTAMMRPVAVTLDLLEQDFLSALPSSETHPFTGLALGSGAGSQDSVSFYCMGRDEDAAAPLTSAANVSPLSDGMRLVELGLRTDATGQLVLVRRMWRDLYATVRADPSEEILARNVSSLSIRYYDGGQWFVEWDPTSQEYRMPVAVVLTLEMIEPLDANAPRGAAPRRYTLSRTIPLPCGVPPAAVNGDAMLGGGG